MSARKKFLSVDQMEIGSQSPGRTMRIRRNIQRPNRKKGRKKRGSMSRKRKSISRNVSRVSRMSMSKRHSISISRIGSQVRISREILLFRQMDIDGDGIISKEDLAQTIKTMSGAVDQDHLNGLYHALADTNGKITKASFIANLHIFYQDAAEDSDDEIYDVSVVRQSPLMSPSRRMRRMSASRKWCAREVSNDLIMDNGRNAKTLAATLFAIIDVHTNGIITLKEFKHAWGEIKEIQGSQDNAFENLFKAIDTHDTGIITESEFVLYFSTQPKRNLQKLISLFQHKESSITTTTTTTTIRHSPRSTMKGFEDEVDSFEGVAAVDDLEMLLESRTRQVEILEQKLKQAAISSKKIHRKFEIVQQEHELTNTERNKLSTTHVQMAQQLENQQVQATEAKQAAKTYKKLCDKMNNKMEKMEEAVNQAKEEQQNVKVKLRTRTATLSKLSTESEQLRADKAKLETNLQDQTKLLKEKDKEMRKKLRKKENELKKANQEKSEYMKEMEELRKYKALAEKKEEEIEELRKMVEYQKTQEMEVEARETGNQNTLGMSLGGIDFFLEYSSSSSDTDEEGDEDDSEDEGDEGDMDQYSLSPVMPFQQQTPFLQALVQKPKTEAMDKLLDQASRILSNWSELDQPKAKDYADAKFIRFLIGIATGIIFIHQVRAAFFIGGSHGSGILLSKDIEGKWSGPHAITTGGVQFGMSAGMAETDTMIILTSDEALNSFARGAFKLGGNMQFAAGPTGYDYSYSNLRVEQGWAPAYSYSCCKGAFFAMALEGTFFNPTNMTNTKYYANKNVTAEMILHHEVVPPESEKYNNLISSLDILIENAPETLIEFSSQTFFQGERVVFIDPSNEKVFGTIAGEMKSGMYHVYADGSTSESQYYFPSMFLERVVQEFLVGTIVIVNHEGKIEKGLIQSEKKDGKYLIMFDNANAIEVLEADIVRQFVDEVEQPETELVLRENTERTGRDTTRRGKLTSSTEQRRAESRPRDESRGRGKRYSINNLIPQRRKMSIGSNPFSPGVQGATIVQSTSTPNLKRKNTFGSMNLLSPRSGGGSLRPSASLTSLSRLVAEESTLPAVTKRASDSLQIDDKMLPITEKTRLFNRLRSRSSDYIQSFKSPKPAQPQNRRCVHCGHSNVSFATMCKNESCRKAPTDLTVGE